MIPREIGVNMRSCLALALVMTPFVAGCGGDAKQLAGHWKRDLHGEGQVEMRLASNGRMELMLPSPRWPDEVDMQSTVAIMGDTVTFKADTTANRCQTADARYVMRREGNELQISGLGMDSCGGRRAALVGRWEKA